MGQRRPHCTACGYDRSGIPPGALCPECGKPMAELRPDDDASPGASRAIISLGLGTLSWIGLVGFGVIAVLLGIGAVAVGVSAIATLGREGGNDSRAMTKAYAGVLLGLTGGMAGVIVALLIAVSL